MKVHLLSDLHQEFAEYQPNPVPADLIILAGDTHTGLNGIRWAQKTFPDKPVIYIAGNHEYYGKNFHGNLKKMRDLAQGTNVHFLENDAVKFGDITFLGATLWTDLNFFGNVPLAEVAVAKEMNDYRKIHIEPAYRRMRPADTAGFFRKSKAWLAAELDKPGRKVVITHHGVSRQSVPPEFVNDPCQPAYTSEMTEFIMDHPAELWIHGHTHRAFDYHIETTRVLTNPRGYPHETNHGFNPSLIVEL